MKKSSFVLLILIVFVSQNLLAQTPSNRTNIVLIVADDLGYGDLSCYGNTNIKTPNIDNLALNGIRFTDFHSNGSVCSPTRASLLTGRYQQRTGIKGVITAEKHRDVGLSLNETTIAEEFKKYNYTTAMYGKWHLGYDKKFNPILQGFDNFKGFVSGNIDYHAHIDQEGYLDWWNGTDIDNEKGYTTDLIGHYGADFIKKNNPKKTKKPFFLYVAQEAPHYPYQRRKDNALRTIGSNKTKKVSKDSISSIYKEMVEVLDESVGEIINTLKDIGEYDNTIILFISDNGASQYGNNGVLRAKKGSVYEGGTRVPAILSYPAKLKEAKINNQTILTIDILPTLLDFIGQKPSAKILDGISIKENLLQEVDLPKRDVFYGFKNQLFIRNGKWKLVEVKTKSKVRLELYDLSKDLSEENDVKESNKIIFEAMKKRLHLWVKEVKKDQQIISK